jgi:uncharacterized protein (TIGR02300 family)
VAREPPLFAVPLTYPRKRSALANPELGAKQICPSCQTKFYDLGRRPAVCPKCGASFDPEEALRSRRVRARATPADYETEEEVEDKKKVRDPEDADGFEDEVEETPEIDEAVEADPIEVDDAEDGAVTPEPAEPDLGVDFEEDVPLEEDDAEDVPFLEEEEDDDFPEDEIEGLPDDEREER